MLMIVRKAEADGSALLLGADAVGVLFRKSGNTVMRWAAARKMPGPMLDPGGQLCWARADIEDFIACGMSMARYRALKSKS